MKTIFLSVVATLAFQSTIAMAQSQCMSEDQAYQAGTTLGGKAYSDAKQKHLNERGRSMGRNFCKECTGDDRRKCYRGYVDGALKLKQEKSELPKIAESDTGCLSSKEVSDSVSRLLGSYGCDPLTDSPNDYGRALCQRLCIECSSANDEKSRSKHEACMSGCALGESKACHDNAKGSGSGGLSENRNATPAT